MAGLMLMAADVAVDARVTSPHRQRRVDAARARRRGAVLCLGLVAAVTGLPAVAVEASWSAFGNVGYAQTNRDYRWQRWIDDGGSVLRDTAFGAQLDLSLNPQWSATVQAKLAPALDHDTRWAATLAWAFVAWRPDNDWLLRAGRLRVPLYLLSERQDVGTTFDSLRLPNDMYWITPTTDFTGLYLTRSATVVGRELTLDAYSGYADTWYRQWLKDGVPGVLPAGARFPSVHVRATGLVATVRGPDITWRLGLHGTRTNWGDGSQTPVRFPRVELAPGLGYYQVDDTIPGPGVPKVSRVHNLIGTLGVDWQGAEGWRVTAEAARVRQLDTDIGADAVSAYVTVARRLGRFTPYATVSSQRSSARQRDWVEKLNTSDLPGFLPGADVLNASQAATAQSIPFYDQWSAGAGLSVELAPNLKLKAEWMHTRIGAASVMANPAPGTETPRRTSLDTRSVVLSFDF
jgi:hypothetical protein